MALPAPRRRAAGAARTSVCIIFLAKALTSFTARGARFLKPTPCSFLRRWMVYSRVTTSCARLIFLPPPPFAIVAETKVLEGEGGTGELRAARRCGGRTG